MATTKKTTTTKTTAPKAPVAEEQTKNKEQLTTDQQCNLFRAVIKCYQVNASYGANRVMTTDRPFTDYFGVFGNKGTVYPQALIAPYWKNVTIGAWQMPLDNDFVKAVMADIDWDHI